MGSVFTTTLILNAILRRKRIIMFEWNTFIIFHVIYRLSRNLFVGIGFFEGRYLEGYILAIVGFAVSAIVGYPL